MTTSAAPAVALRGVTKVFRPPPAPWRRLLGKPPLPHVTALRDVTFDIGPGEVFGLVGPNGAGKTVLMKLVATLSEPSEGVVHVFGRDARRDALHIRGRIGMATTDERSFYWRLTCRQNLMFFARLHGIAPGAAARRVAELFELFDIEGLADQPYRVLSAGNRQRLAIARALLSDPELLLLDEPTSSMDPFAAANLRRLVADRLHDRARRTVLYTTHNLAEVEELCDRVAVLHAGRVLECSDLASLFARFGPGEIVTVTCGGSLVPELVGRLRVRVAGLEAGARTLRFPRERGDRSLDEVMAELVRSGMPVLGCETRHRRFEEVFDRLIRRNGDAQER